MLQFPLELEHCARTCSEEAGCRIVSSFCQLQILTPLDAFCPLLFTLPTKRSRPYGSDRPYAIQPSRHWPKANCPLANSLQYAYTANPTSQHAHESLSLYSTTCKRSPPHPFAALLRPAVHVAADAGPNKAHHILGERAGLVTQDIAHLYTYHDDVCMCASHIMCVCHIP